MDIKTTSPESIYEREIFVPWDTDLPFELRLWEPNEDDPSTPLDFNFAGHKIIFRIFQYEPATEDQQPIIEFENSSFERDQSNDQQGTSITNILRRLIRWEELEDIMQNIDYFYLIIGESPLPERYTIMQGPFRKGSD